ncbi:AraC family transcriptional regulator [Niabella ginsenosidivorans]|uniref:AraC family transcriptional regulator n=1 Tax=Niabella ginsenosidivorans TaxID=1176587 RepID=A0A1A9I8A0_9BACT|nr:helix-turn-helix domain-containing protein [Niabella ginsenosidivorans]ANH83813.1 AraC family transcriptional regulator [Niabella ginsenosidivorans]
MKKVCVYVPANGIIESITPAVRIFQTANDFLASNGLPPKFKVELAGLKKNASLSNGLYTISTDHLLKDVTDADLLIIPALMDQPMQQAVELNKPALPLITAMHARGTEVASLCLGAFLLAATGLLDGRKCSTHWAYYNEFMHLYPNTEVADGSVITDEAGLYSSGGANSIWNLLLYLVEKFTYRELAVLLAKFFAIDIDRNSQNAFSIFKGQKDHNDEAIIKTQEYIEQNISERISIDQLASMIAVGRRSFERRFKQATNNTVLEYIQRVRIEAAKRKFESKRLNINEVMYDVGYTDTKAFRDVFKKVTGLTPIEYRNKYYKPNLGVGISFAQGYAVS